MDELEHAVKAGHLLGVARVRLQVKGAGVALDAQVLGARGSLDTEGEEVAVVRAVAHQEGAGGLGAEHGTGLLAPHGAPVEAALLELAHGRQHQLVLQA